ncbi:hypothetical protein ABZ479_32285 [Streptomyces sp. NPDC005722]
MNRSNWYVLVEEDVSVFQSINSETGDYFQRWSLTSARHSEEGKEKARELALDTARSHLPQRRSWGNGTPGRTVYRLTEDSWLVELRFESWRSHFRVSLAEAIHVSEEQTAEPFRPARSATDAPGPVARMLRRGR